MATVPPAPRAGPAPVPRRRRRRGRLLQAAAAALAALALPRAGAAAPAGPENLLGVEASERCRVKFSAKGFLEAVIFFNPTLTEAFSDRSDRDALTAPASMFAKSFFWLPYPSFAQPTMAINGWREKKKGGGWKKAYAVVTNWSGTWDAAAQKLQYRVKQFPRQARVTKNFGGKNLAGKKVELRFCTMFLEELHWKFKDAMRAGDL